MCGIAGLVASKPRELDPAAAERMQNALLHRGPDDRGLFVSNNSQCALAHTRLSILDLSPAGHQPMPSADGRYQIVFNGEIYNYRELREDISREQGAGSWKPKGGEQRSEGGEQGAVSGEQVRPSVSGQSADRPQVTHNPPTWKSNSDTEVILHAYAKWGRDCVNYLRGMFAFAIWDEQRQELFLARDPFGIKPLYYYQTGRLFLFASEVRALLASDLVPKRLSHDGLVSYLQSGSVRDPLTVIDGVRALLPGRYLNVLCKDDMVQVETSSYAMEILDPPTSPRIVTRSEAVEILRANLEESVRRHLISDVPLGAFLSGGIDSSAIVALMSRVADKPLKTFSVVFEETDFSEAEHAKLVARKFGTEHHEILLSEQSLLSMLPNALSAMDQPTMDGINTYVVAKAVKEAGVTVALSGLGGDELFAGYPSFRRAMHLQRFAIAPSAMRRVASTAGRAILNGSVGRRKLWDMVESDCSPYSAYAISRQLFAPAEIAALTRDQRSEVSGRQEQEIRDQMAEVGKSAMRNPKSEIERDVVNAVSRYELTGYMVNTLLRDTDQMSMAHGLEVRVPFVDPVVAHYVLGLPGEWKLNGGRPKPLLVDALGDLLPEQIWKRTKMGFTLPLQRWMKSALQPKLSGALSNSKKLTQVPLNPEPVANVWAAFKANPQQQSWSRPWALYVLQSWCEQNGVHV